MILGSCNACDRLHPNASFLGPLMREHVERMRSLGYLYQANERVLLRFDRFLQGRPDLRGAPLRTVLEAWRIRGRNIDKQ
jgi:integrase/recombinase XerD